MNNSALSTSPLTWQCGWWAMCKWGTTVPTKVWIPADMSATGEARWCVKPIDSCVADIVRALQDGGINMRGSCCGHGKDFGNIILEDGRILSVCPAADYRSLKWALRAAWQIIRNTRLVGRALEERGDR